MGSHHAPERCHVNSCGCGTWCPSPSFSSSPTKQLKLTVEWEQQASSTLIAFLLPFILSILAWARVTLLLIACNCVRLASTRWEILREKKMTTVQFAIKCLDSSWGLQSLIEVAQSSAFWGEGVLLSIEAERNSKAIFKQREESYRTTGVQFWWQKENFAREKSREFNTSERIDLAGPLLASQLCPKKLCSVWIQMQEHTGLNNRDCFLLHLTFSFLKIPPLQFNPAELLTSSNTILA